MALIYILPGIPTPLARHRFSRKGSIYDSQKHLKLVLGITFRNIHGDRDLYEGPLHLDVKFFFPWRAANLKTKPYWHIYTPDADNCLKLICDVGNKILWDDDKTICKVSLEKRYDKNPRTEFTVHQLEDYDSIEEVF